MIYMYIHCMYGCLQPRELWFIDLIKYMYIHVVYVLVSLYVTNFIHQLIITHNVACVAQLTSTIRKIIILSE